MLDADPAVLVLHNGKICPVATFLKKDGKSPDWRAVVDDSKGSANPGKTFYGGQPQWRDFYMSIFRPVYDANKN